MVHGKSVDPNGLEPSIERAFFADPSCANGSDRRHRQRNICADAFVNKPPEASPFSTLVRKQVKLKRGVT